MRSKNGLIRFVERSAPYGKTNEPDRRSKEPLPLTNNAWRISKRNADWLHQPINSHSPNACWSTRSTKGRIRVDRQSGGSDSERLRISYRSQRSEYRSFRTGHMAYGESVVVGIQLLSFGEKSPLQCAGINRHEAENAKFLRVRSSDPLGPEVCVGYTPTPTSPS